VVEKQIQGETILYAALDVFANCLGSKFLGRGFARGKLFRGSQPECCTATLLGGTQQMRDREHIIRRYGSTCRGALVCRPKAKLMVLDRAETPMFHLQLQRTKQACGDRILRMVADVANTL
jgi:hypothetical protein